MQKFILSLLLIVSISASGQPREKFHRAKIFLNGSSLLQLTRLGLDTDHGDYRKGFSFTSDFSESELQKVAKAGLTYQIEIPDVINHYKNQKSSAGSVIQNKIQSLSCLGAVPQYPAPAHFALGSYSGYFYYQEMLDILDTMAALYPNLITIKQNVSPTLTTFEGRPLYYVKISDNPAIAEAEAQILYTAVHHAREPGGMSSLIYYMWYLLENYSTTSEIQDLVNNTEMYFIPCVNPDGYLYNEMTDPSGGGLWRKNRRDNLDGTYGIDLNRNYGYNWGFDDIGSSPNTMDATYRGDSAFSESETQMVRDFAINHNFKIAINYHTYGNLFIYPWGYIASYFTPDSALLENYGALLTSYNDYSYGTADQTVGYITNGSSDDWMYGDQSSKPKVLSFTPEAGDPAMGFWPPPSDIIPICQNNMFLNLTAAKLLGRYTRINDLSSDLISSATGYIQFSLTQLGLDTSGSYTVSLVPASTNINSTGIPKLLNNFNVGSTQYDSIAFSLNFPLPYGTQVKFVLQVNNGQYVTSDTITKTIGNYIIAYSTNANAITGWQSSTGWGIDNTIFFSATGSFADSPLGNYTDNNYNELTTTSNIDLTNAIKATLEFYTRYAVEPRYDYVQALASDNNGATWTPLCGKYTKTGGLSQDPGNPVYSGFRPDWIKEQISLNDYLGMNIRLRFLLVSDSWTEYDGYYVDDLVVKKVVAGGVGLNEINPEIVQYAFPNPASEWLYIYNSGLNAGDKAIVRISDLPGKTLAEETLTADSHHTLTLGLTKKDLAPGIYFYQTETSNRKFSLSKIVIQ